MTEDYSNHQEHKKPRSCKKNVNQYTEITLPIKLEPITAVGEIETECCGEPHVVCKTSCDSHSELFITQTIKLTIPIEYRINKISGKSKLKCKNKDCA